MERPEGHNPSLPVVPLSLEGWSMLHQMFRLRWSAWKALPTAEQQNVLEEALSTLTKMEQGEIGRASCRERVCQYV